MPSKLIMPSGYSIQSVDGKVAGKGTGAFVAGSWEIILFPDIDIQLDENRKIGSVGETRNHRSFFSSCLIMYSVLSAERTLK